MAAGAEPLKRTKSFLPQRRTSVLADGYAASMLSRANSTQQRGEQQRQRSPSKESSLARRTSLVRPPHLKSRSSTVSSSTAGSINSSVPAPTSSRKPSTESRPRSPQKAALSLPRVGRSASVHSTSGLMTANAGLPGISRRQSQVVRGQTVGQVGKQKETAAPLSEKRQHTVPGQSNYSKKITRPSPTTASVPNGREEPSVALISSSWPEIAALQTELLQLNLFHSSYLQRNIEWRTHAETSLRENYDHIANTYRSTVAEEKETQRRLNFQALSVWIESARKDRGWEGFSEQIQTLSSIVQDVSDISANSGKYAHVIRVFEDWFQNAGEIRKDRDNSDQMKRTNGNAMFINPLDTSWKRDLYLVTSKLELCARRLQSLDILQGESEVLNYSGSALVRILLGLGEMITLMVEELDTMRMIENDIIRSERAWVTQRTEQLASSPPDLREDRVGIWSAV